MSRTTNNKLNRRKYETEPDVFELEEMREREERYWSLDEDDPEEWYEEAFDCVMLEYYRQNGVESIVK